MVEYDRQNKLDMMFHFNFEYLWNKKKIKKVLMLKLCFIYKFFNSYYDLRLGFDK